MIVALIFLAGAATAVPSTAEPFDRVSPQQAAEHVSQCGVGNVAVSYDGVLQEHILTATHPPELSDDQLTCADKAANFYDLKFPQDTQKRYDAIRSARLRVYAIAEARRWLSERGLLSKVPSYISGVTDPAVFSHQVEDMCGPLAKGAFQSKYGPHAINPEWGGQGLNRGKKFEEAFGCVLYATTVAQYEVGLVGNEKIAEPKKGTP